MNDLPWEAKKDSKKEPPMDTPPVEFPWEKGSSKEGTEEPSAAGGMAELEPEPSEPDVALFTPQPPFFSNNPNTNETVAPPFENEGLQISTVHAVEKKEPAEIPVISGFPEEGSKEDNTGIQNVIPTKPDKAEDIASFVDVFGVEQDEKAGMDRIDDLVPRSKTPPPLFQPNLQLDDENMDNIMVDDEKDDTVDIEPTTLQTSEDVPFETGTEQFTPVQSSQEEAPTEQILEPMPAETTPMDAQMDTSNLSPFPTPDANEAPPPFPIPDSERTAPPFPPIAPVSPSSQETVKNAAPTIASPKRRVDSISALFKNALKNLMRGGNLIDRMEEMRGNVDLAKEEKLKEETTEGTTSEVSPFEKESTSITPTPTVPPDVEMIEEETTNVMGTDDLPFEKGPEIITEKIEPLNTEDETLTMPPISKTFPEMEIAEEEKQEDTNTGNGIGDENVREIVMAQIEKVLSERPESGGDESSLKSRDVEELKDEIAGSKTRVDEIVDNIEALSNALNTAHDSIQTIRNDSEKFDSARGKIDVIENRLTFVEEGLATIQSDNTDLKNGLANIEQNVSELLNSYSVLLTQINESAASNESTISELTEKANRIYTIESTVQNLEKSLAATGETIVELGNTMSALMNNVAEAYEANKVLGNESKNEFQKFHEEMNSFTKHVDKEIKKFGAEGYRSLGQSIQLTHLQKNSATMKVCMEWLEFLMELVGRNNLTDILAYYEELEWITDDVRLELLRYAEGIDYYLEKPDWKLNPDDHVKSIWFIEKLAGVKIDKNRLSVIDRDIEKVKKGMEIHGI